MRKISIIAVVVALFSLVASAPVRAEDAGMLEITGNVTSVTGWQRATVGKYLDPSAGVLSDGLRVPGAAGTEQFGFFIDQVEVDLAKSFGENIRFRADLDFFPFNGAATPGRNPVLVATGLNPAGGSADYVIEQAYTTANIPAGNGWELLVGRFNSGIGLDSVDRNELSTVSHSTAHRVLLPHNLTGARLGYNWTDDFRWETFVVNDLGDVAPGAVTAAGAARTTVMPSFGFNAVRTWGFEENPNWFKFSGAGGPEQAAMKHWSFLGDMAISYAATDSFRWGFEGVYRQDDALAGGNNAQYLGGGLQGTYSFSDVWDGTLRYGYTWDFDTGQAAATTIVANNDFAPGLGGALANGGVRHDFALATGYAITEGARFGLEGRFDLTNPSAAANGGAGQNIGLAGMFAYSF